MHDNRRSIRLPGYDYRTPGAYFVTLCTQGRVPCLSRVVAGQVRLLLPGRGVQAVLARLLRAAPHMRLDSCVIMPDHVHLVCWLHPTSGGSTAAPNGAGAASHSLAALMQAFKARSAHAVYRRCPEAPRPFWQRGYYEQIVRDAAGLARIRRYIAANPTRWQQADDSRPTPYPPP